MGEEAAQKTFCRACIYCDREAGDTSDHVPPQLLLRKPYPPNLLTVPSCVRCNNGPSKDEEYFRLIVVGLMCHSTEAEVLFGGPMSRSMDRNSGIEDLMFGSLLPFDTAVALDIAYSRIFRIAEKITRGLQFASTGVAYPVEQKFEVRFGEVEGGSEDSTYGPDFSFRRLTDASGGWEFTLFDSVRFVVRSTFPRLEG